MRQRSAGRCTFERMQATVERFTEAMAPEASFIFNAVIDQAHEPAVLLLMAFKRCSVS